MSIEAPKQLEAPKEPIITPDLRIDPVMLGKVRAFAHSLAQTSALEKSIDMGHVMMIYELDENGETKKDRHGNLVGTVYPNWLDGMKHINFLLFCDIRDGLGLDIAEKIVSSHISIQKDEVPHAFYSAFEHGQTN